MYAIPESMTNINIGPKSALLKSLLDLAISLGPPHELLWLCTGGNWIGDRDGGQLLGWHGFLESGMKGTTFLELCAEIYKLLLLWIPND